MVIVVAFDRATVADADHDAAGSSVRTRSYSANSRPSSSAEVASSRKTAFGLVSRT
jgi:hypothetical protein